MARPAVAVVVLLLLAIRAVFAEAASSEPPTAHRIYLPYAADRSGWAPGPTRVWGTHLSMEWDESQHALDLALEPPRLKGAGITALRTNLYWRDVEPVNTTPDRYAWAGYDARLAAYSADGRDVVVSVVAYPKWAMVYACGYGFTSPEMADEWRAFMRAAAERYRDAPYRVVAWEIGNEVDGKTVVTAPDRERPPEWGGGEPMPPQIGCWGDRPAAYLAFLKPAYGAIKAVDPDVPARTAASARPSPASGSRSRSDRPSPRPDSRRC